MIILSLAIHECVLAQGVKIGSAGNADANAILELDGSNGKGLLLPRISDAQMNAMTPPDGMIVYNTTNGAIYLRKAGSWQVLAGSNGAGGFALPNTSSHTVDNGYVLNLTNNSFNGVNGGIRGHSSTSGYGLYGSSFTGIGGYFTSTTGPSLVTGAGNVGLGTAMPNARLHALANNQDLLQVENSNTLNSGQNTRMLYKTGSYYTGGIGTSGIAVEAARMSFFTGVAITPASLSEKMSILHGGNVGINNTNPVARLDVAGKIKATAQYGEDAALELTGAIKVVGSNQAAFVLTATINNISNNGQIITIDHPHANNNPTALIFVTGRQHQDFSLLYNVNTGRWYLYTNHKESPGYINLKYQDCSNVCKDYTIEMKPEPLYFSTGDKFNILIIKTQ